MLAEWRNSGRVYVYYGSATGPPMTPSMEIVSPSPQADGSFGNSVAGAGDFDADGFADVAIGALREELGPSNAGRVYYFGGSTSGLAPRPGVVIDSPTADRMGAFGHAVRSVGDLNGDGLVDIAIGAFQEDIGGLTDVGRAYVYAGSPAGLTTTPDVRLESVAPSDGGTFGWDLAGAHDIDGDGLSELVVSAAREQSGSTPAAGRGYVYSGNTVSFLLPTPAEADSPAPEDMGGFASAIASADVNGDGLSDLLICAQQEDVGGITDAGRLHVIYGGGSDLSIVDTVVSPSPGMLRNFCNAVAGIGDVNGDGFDDVAVGAWLEDFGGETAAGRVHLFLGGVDGIAGTPTSTVGSGMPQNFGGFGSRLGG